MKINGIEVLRGDIWKKNDSYYRICIIVNDLIGVSIGYNIYDAKANTDCLLKFTTLSIDNILSNDMLPIYNWIFIERKYIGKDMFNNNLYMGNTCLFHDKKYIIIDYIVDFTDSKNTMKTYILKNINKNIFKYINERELDTLIKF